MILNLLYFGGQGFSLTILSLVCSRQYFSIKSNNLINIEGVSACLKGIFVLSADYLKKLWRFILSKEGIAKDL
jgi:hypothetical protein